MYSIKSNQLTVLFALVVAISLFANVGLVDGEKDSSDLAKLRVKPKVSFSYCFSCGYRKAFEEYSTLLIHKYPSLVIEGRNYTANGFNMYLSKLVYVVKILLIMIVVWKYNIFGMLGLPVPSWWRHLLDNKLYTCLMIFFVGNLIESQLVASGAFEISINDVPVWSKLQTGRIPSPQELFQIIDNQLLFAEKVQENPDFVK